MRRGILIVRSLNRPAFTVLLALCCVVGMAQTGHLPSTPRLYLAIGAVGAWMLFAVALNDIVDAEIDRANLVDDPRRMLAARAVERGHLVGVAAISGIVSLSAAALLGRMALVVVACGLVLAAAYSLPPFRLSGRGVVTSVLLPLGYVAVPYLVGAAASDPLPGTLSPVLLVGLYLGFLGRLTLKDFRDEEGDRLYDKRTTLVRYGRTATCMFSASFWTAGALVVLADRATSPVLMISVGVCTVAVLALLRDVAGNGTGSRDRANISGIAMAGRSLVVVVLADMLMAIEGWSPARRDLVGIVLIGVVIARVVAARSHGLPAGECSRNVRETPPGEIATDRSGWVSP